MRHGWTAGAVALLAAGPAWAGGTIVLDRPGMRSGPDLAVTSAAFPPGGTIPREFSPYDENVPLPVRWSLGPATTKSFALIIEDPDAASPTPIVHWLVWNISAATIVLPEGTDPQTATDARMGQNSHNTLGYYGPHPPPGDPPHHYHVEVFGLDRALPADIQPTLDAVSAAMAGHVVAHGELIGSYQMR